MSNSRFILACFALSFSATQLVIAEDFSDKSAPEAQSVKAADAAKELTLLVPGLGLDCNSTTTVDVDTSTVGGGQGVFTISENITAANQAEANKKAAEKCKDGKTKAEDDAKAKAKLACEALVAQTALSYDSGQTLAECKDNSGRCQENKSCEKKPTRSNIGCTATVTTPGTEVIAPTATTVGGNNYIVSCLYTAAASGTGGLKFVCGACQ